jgi:hypothetical protein
LLNKWCRGKQNIVVIKISKTVDEQKIAKLSNSIYFSLGEVGAQLMKAGGLRRPIDLNNYNG